jgi:hypothetical protein
LVSGIPAGDGRIVIAPPQASFIILLIENLEVQDVVAVPILE